MNKDIYQQALKLRIDEVLHYVWDPIGISNEPLARNEYSSYTDLVLQAVLEHKTADEIAAILDTICAEHLGIDTNEGHSSEVAALIIAWAQFLIGDTPS